MVVYDGGEFKTETKTLANYALRSGITACNSGGELSHRGNCTFLIRPLGHHEARLDPDAALRESEGAWRIHHESSCLGQVMARAGLWADIKRFYEPLRLPKTEGIALSRAEEEHLFAPARIKTKWFVAYYCGLISRNTTAGPSEIRHLRLGDIVPDGSYIQIELGVKNVLRKRPCR